MFRYACVTPKLISMKKRPACHLTFVRGTLWRVLTIFLLGELSQRVDLSPFQPHQKHKTRKRKEETISALLFHPSTTYAS